MLLARGQGGGGGGGDAQNISGAEILSGGDAVGIITLMQLVTSYFNHIIAFGFLVSPIRCVFVQF